jgi:hypothetical protein
MDIHFQPVPEDEVEGYKIYTFGYRAAVKVEGLQALVNRWVKTFLTPAGSDPHDLSAGTEFGNLIGGNIGTHSAALLDEVIMAIDSANDQVQQQDLDGLYPSNESLQSAKLLNYSPNEAGDGFDLWVEITNNEDETLSANVANNVVR